MNTKTCSTCKHEKPVDDFRRDDRRKDGRQSRCKECTRRAYKIGYDTKYRVQVKARNKATYDANRRAIDTYKATHGCGLCLEREPVCLEFHHLDPKQKDVGIAHYMLVPLETVWKEIEKCVILCSNCHKKVHAGILELQNGNYNNKH